MKIYIHILVIDTIGIPTSGFADGVQSSFGEYDECLNIKSQNSEDNNNVFTGQYCLLKLILPYPEKEDTSQNQTIELGSRYANEMNLQKLFTVKALIERLNLWNGTVFRFGICIPSVCSAHEIENMLNKSRLSLIFLKISMLFILIMFLYYLKIVLFPITRLPLEVGPKCQIKDEAILLDSYQIISM